MSLERWRKSFSPSASSQKNIHFSAWLLSRHFSCLMIIIWSIVFQVCMCLGIWRKGALGLRKNGYNGSDGYGAVTRTARVVVSAAQHQKSWNYEGIGAWTCHLPFPACLWWRDYSSKEQNYDLSRRLQYNQDSKLSIEEGWTILILSSGKS